ncbi:DUF2968 domain-containing protein [Collimonas pratensis]|uniref:Uncharacterized protein n=1 Tax=Collimonas pratensis TaxID=279113 RepID=A0ABN4ME87_9BURK|nr:DUF2968 domain-containing protein [Collimonas pratensis]AMP16336.1 hypothetical protein CPter291_4103 [Collimonas pratensis]NKI70665.1 DUF2968 domain-containing protein [Collimonas pratensis]
MRSRPSTKFFLHKIICLALFGLAPLSGAALAAGAMPAMAAANGVPAASPGSLAELKQRLSNKSVRELRTSYSGEYGTTLLMADNAPVFYVALLNQKSLWRVLRFDNLALAERSYVQLSQRSADWAGEEIRLQVLNAQSQALERSKQESEARLAALHTDMQIMQSEQARIMQGRQAAQEQVRASEIERRAYQIELDQLRRNIRTLESQLSGAHGPAN